MKTITRTFFDLLSLHLQARAIATENFQLWLTDWRERNANPPQENP